VGDDLVTVEVQDDGVGTFSARFATETIESPMSVTGKARSIELIGVESQRQIPQLRLVTVAAQITDQSGWLASLSGAGCPAIIYANLSSNQPFELLMHGSYQLGVLRLMA
jgi:hypothetical protein